MSHFCALVIVPQDSLEIEHEVRQRLEPYDLEKEVAPYFDGCWCLATASDEAYRYAEQHAPFPRWKYRQMYDALAGEKPPWEEFSREWQAVKEEAERAHPLYQQADPTCEDCHGSGTCLTTANPNGKWDWWQIGGRWTGALTPEYDPRQDIENQEWCELCEGTGNRSDLEFYADPDQIATTVYALQADLSSAESHSLSEGALRQTPAVGHQRVEWCNGCQGKGLRPKWPTQWKPFAGDMRLVQQIPTTFCPYAIVLPDGTWLEDEETASGNLRLRRKDINPQWQQTVKEVLAQYADDMGVVVDCHW